MNIPTRRRYIILIALISLLQAVESMIFVFVSEDTNLAKGQNVFSGAELVIVSTCEILLYLIQTFVLIAGCAIFASYVRLGKANPSCVSD